MIYLRLVFPTVQQNVSAWSVLGSFIEVCGRKIDSATGVLDRVVLVCLECFRVSKTTRKDPPKKSFPRRSWSKSSLFKPRSS